MLKLNRIIRKFYWCEERFSLEHILMVILFIIVTIQKISENKKVLKALSKNQLVGVGLSYILSILIAFVCIYYGGNWIAGYIPNEIIKFLIQVMIILLTLYLCVSMLNKTLKKITKGVLPEK